MVFFLNKIFMLSINNYYILIQQINNSKNRFIPDQIKLIISMIETLIVKLINSDEILK